MEGFDDPGVFFSDDWNAQDRQNAGDDSRQHSKEEFRDFLRNFHEGNFNYTYRFFFFRVIPCKSY